MNPANEGGNSFGDSLRNIWQKVSSPTHTRTISILALLIIIAAVPLTVYIAQKQQEIRQRATEYASCTDTDGNPVNDGKQCGEQSETCGQAGYNYNQNHTCRTTHKYCASGTCADNPTWEVNNCSTECVPPTPTCSCTYVDNSRPEDNCPSGKAVFTGSGSPCIYNSSCSQFKECVPPGPTPGVTITPTSPPGGACPPANGCMYRQGDACYGGTKTAGAICAPGYKDDICMNPAIPNDPSVIGCNYTCGAPNGFTCPQCNGVEGDRSCIYSQLEGSATVCYPGGIKNGKTKANAGCAAGYANGICLNPTSGCDYCGGQKLSACPQPIITITPTGPTATPTNTPIPGGPTATPTNTPTPTPTIAPNETILNFDLTLVGIGKDLSSGEGGVLPANTSPKTTTKELNVEIYQGANDTTPIKTGKGNIIYDSSSKTFKGHVSLGTDFATGDYVVKVRADKFKKKQVGKGEGREIQHLIRGQDDPNKNLNNLVATLLNGDMNNDGTIDGFDYNIYYSCFGDRTDPSCGANKFNVDLNDDGQTDQKGRLAKDYRILLYAFSKVSGD